MAKKTADTGAALQQLKADLKSGDVKQLYIFYGEESYLREFYRAALIKKLVSGPAGEFNLHRFTASTFTPQAFSDAVEAMPMMAERTLILVEDVDLFTLPEAPREQVREILSDLSDYCCVLFDYDTVAYKPNGQMKKLTATLQKAAQVIDFQRQTERALCDWIAKHFLAEKKTISDKLCQYLIFLTDGSMTLLGSEISKVCSYASGSEIQKSDIDAVVIPVLNAQTFDISDAIVKGNFALALQKTQELFAMQTEPLLILGAIGSQLRRLYYAKQITACGKGQETLMELTHLSSYPAGLTMTAARRVSERFCERAVELCLKTDIKIKTSADEPERVLELLIVQLAGEAKNG